MENNVKKDKRTPIYCYVVRKNGVARSCAIKSLCNSVLFCSVQCDITDPHPNPQYLCARTHFCRSAVRSVLCCHCRKLVHQVNILVTCSSGRNARQNNDGSTFSCVKSLSRSRVLCAHECRMPKLMLCSRLVSGGTATSMSVRPATLTRHCTARSR